MADTAVPLSKKRVSELSAAMFLLSLVVLLAALQLDVTEVMFHTPTAWRPVVLAAHGCVPPCLTACIPAHVLTLYPCTVCGV